jgi:hypothetical protein
MEPGSAIGQPLLVALRSGYASNFFREMLRDVVYDFVHIDAFVMESAVIVLVVFVRK